MRNIKRLEGSGLVKVVGNPNEKPKRYKFTPAFNETYADVINKTAPNTKRTVHQTSSFTNRMQEKLKTHKEELLVALGEMEEYDAICKEYPQKINSIQERFNHARDCYSKTLGRVKALESLVYNQELS